MGTLCIDNPPVSALFNNGGIMKRGWIVTVAALSATDFHPPISCQVLRIHAELPPGGILVFLTGQREVALLCRRLKAHFLSKSRRAAAAEAGAAAGGRSRDVGDADDGSRGGGEEADEDVDEVVAVEQYGGGGDAAEVQGDAAEWRRSRNGEDEQMDDYEVSCDIYSMSYSFIASRCFTVLLGGHVCLCAASEWVY